MVTVAAESFSPLPPPAGGEGRTLNAGVGDDILIGGWTSYDLGSSGMTYDKKLVALEAIMAEWGSTDSYATRRSAVAGDLNINTVHDNIASGVAVEDQLHGDALANDWFFAALTIRSPVRTAMIRR